MHGTFNSKAHIQAKTSNRWKNLKTGRLSRKRVTHTWNKLETEVGTGRVARTRATATTRKPKLKRWTIRPSVAILGNDPDDCLAWRSILVYHWTIVLCKLWEVVIHVHQMHYQRSSASLCRSACFKQ